MLNDLFWAIQAQAAEDIAARVRAYMAHLQAKGVTEGPAEEAGRDGLPIRVTGGVAVIPVMGPMIRRAGPIARLFGIAGTDGIRLAVQSALADKDVTSILLRVDSPGGSVSGLDQLGDTIAAAEKPVVAQVEGIAASAAYYVASQADSIYMSRGDLVGSIGTRMMLYDFSKMFDQAGVKAIPVDTGKFKSAGAMGTEITEEQIADFQRIVDYYYADFVSMVATGRGMTEKQVRSVGDGRMFTSEEAAKSGLIDGTATYQETLNEMRTTVRRSTDAARAQLRL